MLCTDSYFKDILRNKLCVLSVQTVDEQIAGTAVILFFRIGLQL